MYKSLLDFGLMMFNENMVLPQCELNEMVTFDVNKINHLSLNGFTERCINIYSFKREID